MLGESRAAVIVLLVLLVAILSRVEAQDSKNASQVPPGLVAGPARANCHLSGPLLHIPSRAAGPEGLLVRVSSPRRGRYLNGAPIAVQMLAAAPSVDGSNVCFTEQGFIDIGFLCPGGQYQAPDGTVWKSGKGRVQGQVDWENCVEPLADVLSFATGKIKSLEGKAIRNYSGGVNALTENAGVVGWSFGGNLAVLAMAKYGERFPALKWYASYESPILGPVDDGRGTTIQPNPFYDSSTDTIDFSRLTYSSEMPIWAWYILRLSPSADWPRGGLFLDGDRNGRFNKDADFGFWADIELGPPLKTFYSPTVTREARDRRVFNKAWPAHIATVEEVEKRQSRVDALRRIPEAVKKFPKLAVLVFESEVHHVRGPIHAPAVAQINAWFDAGVRWARFNPDAHYVEWMMGKKPSREIQYPAMNRVVGSAISDLLEPEPSDGGPTNPQGMAAAMSELADRVRLDDWTPRLAGVLHTYERTGLEGRGEP